MYEPVSEGSYIKMIDMVSGGGKMEVSSQFKPKENVQKDLFIFMERAYLYLCCFIPPVSCMMVRCGGFLREYIPYVVFLYVQVNSISGYLPGRIVFFLVS